MKRLAVVTAGVGVVAALLGLGGGSAQAATTPPYSDPRATTALALCGPDGRPVTSGRIDQKPFVWRAVSAASAPAPYNQIDGTATLFAFQPRPQVDPSGWSGDLLTASARYTDRKHPMAAATRLDEPLKDFLAAYPTKVDGFVQLRLYLGAPGQPAYTLKYAAANIQVTGNTWHLVGAPAAVSCASGKAVSLEAILPNAKAALAPPVAMKPASGPTAKSPDVSAGAAGTTPIDTTLAASTAGTKLATRAHPHHLTGLIVGGLIVVAGGSVLWWWLMRRAARGMS